MGDQKENQKDAEKGKEEVDKKATTMCLPEHLGNFFTKHKWLPIKIHYFLMFGTVAGVYPFLPLIGKDLGLSATAVGITFTITPILIFIFKPIFGYIADRLQNIKALVICLMTGAVAVLIVVIFIQPIQKISDIVLESYLEYKGKTVLYRNLSSDFDENCVRNVLTLDRINCRIAYRETNNVTKNSLVFQTKFRCTCNNSHPHKDCENNENLHSMKCFIFLKSNISKMKGNKFSSTECEDVFEACLASTKHQTFLATYQFWSYTVLLLTAGVFYTTSMSLTDVACYDILGEHKEYYGRQRVWGTISTGVVTLFTGYLNDYIGRNEQKPQYLAGYYIMIASFILNIGLLAFMTMPKSNFSKTIISDVKKFFQSLDIIVYGISVFLIGTFSGLVANYLFWYLRELGANQTLLGLTITSQCLTAEVPFFFFSGWIVKRLSHFHCLTCSFAAFCLRFGLYSFLKNPWYTLPIEILHGVTYAVFYASKTAFASVYAPPGTEATLLGILGGLCDGLGYATGSFLGGLGFDGIGGRQTFLLACFMSFLCVPVTFFAHFVFKKRLLQ